MARGSAGCYDGWLNVLTCYTIFVKRSLDIHILFSLPKTTRPPVLVPLSPSDTHLHVCIPISFLVQNLQSQADRHLLLSGAD